MKKTFCYFYLVLYFKGAAPQTGRTVFEDFLQPYRVLRRLLLDYSSMVKQQNFSPLRKEKMQIPIPETQPFSCDVRNQRSVSRPNSVHRLRPGDIDAVAAMGDSLTAGIGITALNFLEELLEERGKSFSVGGDGNWRLYLTLPNILKMFNPNITGYSVGVATTLEENSQLNIAEANAISSDMVYMAHQLIKRMKSIGINFTEDWKMVTIFIGCNNFCAHICYTNDLLSVLEDHRRDMVETIRVLRDHLPRTIINFVTPPNLQTLVKTELDPNSICHLTRKLQCPCLFGLPNENKQKMFFELMRRWQQVDEEVCDLEEFDTDDFTVILQPFLSTYEVPRRASGATDTTFLSADCFHLSQKSHAMIANDLWNNIMEPVGNKSLGGSNWFERFNCPTKERPFIFTRRNSGKCCK